MQRKKSYKVINSLLLEGGTAVTLETKGETLYNGKRLKDSKGKVYTIQTVGMCNNMNITIIALNEVFNDKVLYEL